MLILGAGSQARVVADILGAAAAAGNTSRTIIGYVEIGKDPARVGTAMLGIKVLGTLDDLAMIVRDTGARQAALAIGDNRVRLAMLERARGLGLELPVIAHPSAAISAHASISAGSTIAALAYVGVEARIGEGCIINTSASVDHDCVLGRCVHVAVGVNLAGNVHVGECSTVGAGACAIPGVRIGRDVTIGAGAAVVNDLPDGVTALGVPAKPKERTTDEHG